MSKKSSLKKGEIVLQEECIIGQNCGPIFGNVRIALPIVEEVHSKISQKTQHILQSIGQDKYSLGKGNR